MTWHSTDDTITTPVTTPVMTPPITVTGGIGDEILNGGAGNDKLDGGIGADTLIGGAGDDIYIVDNIKDVITESAGEGADSVSASVSYTLSANLENLTLTGTADIDATGNAGANTLTGNAGANILNGGIGADTLIGGAGNDYYIVDNIKDVITESAGEGTDFVRASVSYTLGANLERLTLTGTSDINATGNDRDNILFGNAGANILDGGGGDDFMSGGAGNDTYIVDSPADLVIEYQGNGFDTIIASFSYTLSNWKDSEVENLSLTGTSNINATGNDLTNTLIGNAGANILDGGAGNDIMSGGAGDDTYIVDNVNDNIVENTGTDVDSVQASVSYTLRVNLENLALTGTANIDAIGNDLNNTLTGNAGANILDGGAGNDTLIGGAGDDIYIVDNIKDVITESAGEGVDSIRASVSYALSANLENLTLTGTAAIDATGNDLNNIFTGNAGANILNGGAGIDKAIYSSLRTDVTVTKTTNGYTVADKTGAEGTDTLINVERLQFDDKSVAFDIDGNAGITAKILGAVFGKDSVANKSYVGIGLGYLDSGGSYGDLMKLAIDAKLGVGASHAAVVNLLFTNIMNRPPGADFLNSYVGALDRGEYTVASLGMFWADTSYNTENINLVGLMTTGIEYYT